MQPTSNKPLIDILASRYVTDYQNCIVITKTGQGSDYKLRIYKQRLTTKLVANTLCYKDGTEQRWTAWKQARSSKQHKTSVV